MIRMASSADFGRIVEIGADVYANLGDYREILPSWLSHPGVEAHVDVVPAPARAEVIRGFVMLGFYEPPMPTGVSPATLVDLLAIAITPVYQRQGIGRQLMRFSIGRAKSGSPPQLGCEMRLTVAEDNPVAQRLFSSFGFEVLDENHGSYDRGQRAIRMGLSLR